MEMPPCADLHKWTKCADLTQHAPATTSRVVANAIAVIGRRVLLCNPVSMYVFCMQTCGTRSTVHSAITSKDYLWLTRFAGNLHGFDACSLIPVPKQESFAVHRHAGHTKTARRCSGLASALEEHGGV